MVTPILKGESNPKNQRKQGRTFKDADKGTQMVTAVHRSHDGSKPSNKDDNGADDRSGNYNSDDSPAHIMPLLEIVRMEKTSPQAILDLITLGKIIKKVPVVVGNCTGFAVNPAFFPYGQGARLLVSLGIDIFRIDRVISSFGMPLGPFHKQFFEEAGEVVDVRLSTLDDGSLKGYGHVEFATAEAAQKVDTTYSVVAQYSLIQLLQDQKNTSLLSSFI